MAKDLTLRKARRLLWSRALWRHRLVFWCGALVVGIAASYFAMLMDRAQDLFDLWIRPHRFLPLLLSPLIFAICVWVTRTYAPAARGSGIPQVIAARIHRDTKTRKRLIGMRVALIKIVLVLLAIFAGAAVGREGPTVQIGAAIMLWGAARTGLSGQRGVVLAGAAAGIAAAFNTPLAGIVFAIEEMARAFEQRNSSIVLIAIVLAGAASMSILGSYDYFGYTSAALPLSRCWEAVFFIGIAGGIMGGLFARCLTHGEPFLRNRMKQFGWRQPVLFAAACGLGVALIGLASGGITYGSGYAMGHGLLHGHVDATWWQMPAKLVATILSAISGIPGGIFSPSLSVGASLGATLAPLFPTTPLQGAILLAMAAYFAGVTQAPITAFVIVLEITGNAADAVPLIAAAVIAAGIGRLFCPMSLYHALARGFMAEKPVSTPDPDPASTP